LSNLTVFDRADLRVLLLEALAYFLLGHARGERRGDGLLDRLEVIAHLHVPATTKKRSDR
jgi:hypothetical protein